MDRPEILGSLRPLGRESIRLREPGIRLEGMMQKQYVQEAKATWNLGKVNIIGMKELGSSKTPEETLEVWTARVWGMTCVGGSHACCREDEGLRPMQPSLLSLFQREAHLQRENETSFRKAIRQSPHPTITTHTKDHLG